MPAKNGEIMKLQNVSHFTPSKWPFMLQAAFGLQGESHKFMLKVFHNHDNGCQEVLGSTNALISRGSMCPSET